MLLCFRLNAKLRRCRAQVISGVDQLLTKACGGFGAMGGCLGILLQHLGVLLDRRGQADLLMGELGNPGIQFIDLTDGLGDGFQ